MNFLAERNCNRALWECGPSLASSAIKQQCIQEIAIVVAPKLLGGSSAMTPLADLGFTTMSDVLHVPNTTMQRLGQDWLFRVLFPLESS